MIILVHTEMKNYEEIGKENCSYVSAPIRSIDDNTSHDNLFE